MEQKEQKALIERVNSLSLPKPYRASVRDGGVTKFISRSYVAGSAFYTPGEHPGADGVIRDYDGVVELKTVETVLGRVVQRNTNPAKVKSKTKSKV